LDGTTSRVITSDYNGSVAFITLQRVPALVVH
jgi:hypothetical protein